MAAARRHARYAQFGAPLDLNTDKPTNLPLDDETANARTAMTFKIRR